MNIIQNAGGDIIAATIGGLHWTSDDLAALVQAARTIAEVETGEPCYHRLRLGHLEAAEAQIVALVGAAMARTEVTP